MKGESTSTLGDMALTVGIERRSGAALAPPAEAERADPGGVPVGMAPTSAPLEALSERVARTFETNARHRRACGVDARLQAQRLMSEARYSKDDLIDVRKTGAPPLYAPVADKKRRAAAAMLSELFNNPGDKPWTLSCTPSPDVPDWVSARAVADVLAPAAALAEAEGGLPGADGLRETALRRMDEILDRREEFARSACRRMEAKIHDQMVEGGWIDAFNDYVENLCVYGTALIRGPEPRRRRTLRYVDSEAGGRVRMAEAVRLEFEAVSPCDVYPAPGARDVDDGPLVVKVRYLPEELRLSASGPAARSGWIPDAVAAVLRASPQGGARDWDGAGAPSADGSDAVAEDSPRDTSASMEGENCTLDGLELFDTLRGSELLGVGLEKDAAGRAIDPEAYYEADVIRVAGVVVYCRILEPEVGRPLCKGVFFKQPDSWWGVGPMEKCADMQRIANAALRDLAVNMAQASGPQFAITDVGRLDPSCGTDMTPWKLWAFGPPPFGQGGNASPIQMFQPNSNASELIRTYEWSDRECGNLCGIRDYTMGGSGAGEIGRTASGYSMLMESATRDFKHAVHQTDVKVIRRTVMRCYAWNMVHGRDESIKGDVRCNPAGMYGMIHREQDYNRKMQFLQLTSNPTDMQIVGIPGRARLLREIARPMEISLDGIVKSPEKLEEEQRMAELRQRAELFREVAGAMSAGPGAEGGEPTQRDEGFRGTDAGRRATVPQPGTGITPQARGAMERVAQAPEQRAMQGMRAAATRAANRAVA